jgi:hypothetical protein
MKVFVAVVIIQNPTLEQIDLNMTPVICCDRVVQCMSKFRYSEIAMLYLLQFWIIVAVMWL